MKVIDIFEGEVIPFPSKDSKFNVIYDDLYRSFIHLWNTGDEWGDTMGTLFAVADELYVRGEGPPDDWKYNPGLSIRQRADHKDKKMSDQEKYDQAVKQQQGTDEYDMYDDLKYANTPTLEKFGNMLMKLRDKLEAEGKSY